MEIILFLIYFIFASFMAFYIPGRVVLGNQKNLSNLGIVMLSTVLGFVLWGWQGYLFGFLNLRFLSYAYLLVFLLVFVKKRYFVFSIPKTSLRKIDWITIVIAVIGVISQIIPYVRTGEVSNLGMFISDYNVLDHIWHISLTGELVKRFPPFEPGMFGIPLINYHFWFNLVTADLIRVFHLPLFPTQFMGMYTLGPILLALSAYVFATAVYNSKLFVRLFFFLLFFAGDAGQWLILILRHHFDTSVGWLFEDGTKLMDAPGRGIAVVIAIAGLYLLFKQGKDKNWKNIFLMSLLFGSLMGFKVYFGIPFLLGLFCLAAYKILRKDFSYLFLFIFSTIFSLIQFVPFNASSGGLFFLAFEIPRQFTIQNSLGLSYIDLRLLIYKQHNNYFRLIEYGVIMSFIYLVAQFGIKIFGLIPLKKTVKALGDSVSVLLYSVLFFTFVLGLFFYQKTGGANIWEFFLASSIALTIIVTLNIVLYLPAKHKILSAILIALIIVIALPRYFISINTYLQLNYLSGFHGINSLELNSYNFLKNSTPIASTVLVLNQDRYIAFSSIVSAITQRDLFFSGEGVSQVLTKDIIYRRKVISILRNIKNPEEIKKLLGDNKIDYVYVYKNSTLKTTSDFSFMKNVFSNSFADIYKLN